MSSRECGRMFQKPMENIQNFAPATHNLVPKESDEGKKVSDKEIYETFSSFMTRIAKLDELVDAASRFLSGFQQALDFLRRPSIDTSHVVLESLVRANSTRQLSSYIEAGCFNSYDSKQNISKSKSVVKELESLLGNAEVVVRATMEDLHPSQDNVVDFLGSYLSPNSKEKDPPSVLRKPEVTDYAMLMASVYWMVKKDYIMQERVVSALSLKSSSEELQSYCLMWSLRPFVDDEIIGKAWSYVR